MNDRAFPFIRLNERESKPRKVRVTEIRGPFYTPMGVRYLEDVLETMGGYVDSLKFAGGSFALMPRQALKGIIELAHRYDVLVSTGGFMERVLAQGTDAVDAYIEECAAVGYLGHQEPVGPGDDVQRLAGGNRRAAGERHNFTTRVARLMMPRGRRTSSSL